MEKLAQWFKSRENRLMLVAVIDLMMVFHEIDKILTEKSILRQKQAALLDAEIEKLLTESGHDRG